MKIEVHFNFCGRSQKHFNIWGRCQKQTTFSRLLKSGLYPAILGKGPYPKLGKNYQHVKIGEIIVIKKNNYKALQENTFPRPSAAANDSISIYIRSSVAR